MEQRLMLLVDEFDDTEEEMHELSLFIAIDEYHRRYMCKQPCRTSILTGHAYVTEILRGHKSRCYDLFRMGQDVFVDFCDALRQRGLLKNSKFISVEEQVAIFLLIVAHNERNRLIAERFQHSGETISRHFKKVLKAVCRLGKELICPPSFDSVPIQIQHDQRYYPFFKNCVGAIDGTHISASVPSDQQIPYRGKKIEPTQNIMCVCSFDMRFTFVMAGWEGTANDARIFLECISNPENHFPMPPEGKYYLVDSGYTNMPGFLSPYRGERYHLSEYRGRGRNVRGPEELFNYRHSSLRNCIERCFGVLKARFPILKQMPPYSLRSQRYIANACCVLHNFIRNHQVADALFEEFESEDFIVNTNEEISPPNTSQSSVQVDVTSSQLRYMSNFRDVIARELWESEHGS